MYNTVSSEDINYFSDLLKSRCLFSDEHKETYSRDETEDLSYHPEVVLKPNSTSEISQILKYCNNKLIPVTPAGARTGLSGGALPIHGGVLLSMELFNKVIEIDEQNSQVITEPGVITEELQNLVKEKGLFYPPDPASKGSCFIGGNIAENSGGPKAVKYGVTSDYVLNLEVILPNGEIIWTGANVLKNATAYNLTQLIVGSEGTLGIVSKIVLKLIPHPTRDMLMLVPFYDAEEACKSVAAIFNEGITPSGLEFMERDALILSQKMIDGSSIEIKDNHEAHLLIEVDGNEIDQIFKECEKISEVLYEFDCGEILIAESKEQKERLWKMRRLVGEAVKSNSIYKEEDTVVPRAELPKLLIGVKEIGEKYGFKSVCYGHAGDGNLHVNIIKGDMSDDKWNNELHKGIREIFILTKELGGTISGEHGIGLVQKPFIDVVFSKKEIEVQKQIKNLFDPNNILNPGKIFN